MKKIIAVIFAISMLFSGIPSAFAAENEKTDFDFAATFGSAISEIRTPTMKPVVNYIVDGLSLSTPGRQDFREYCDKNFQ